MENLPTFWQQMIYVLVIAVAMIFGGHLYRKRQRKASGSDAAASKHRAAKKRPRKKR